MSESVRSNVSTPSLSAYPPAFVSLITTFIQQAEDAEMRAHKALVILNAKDQQVFQLQERMNTLEKLASKLEEVIVPPLELPLSSPSSLAEESPHPRDNVPLETLYRRLRPDEEQEFEGKPPEGHNCYLQCQRLINGLERSNSQLREALTSESTQRVRDHEQYVETLAQVTQAVKHWQSSENQQKHSLEQQVLETTDITHGAGDTYQNGGSRLKGDPKDVHLSTMLGGDMAVIDRTGLMKSLEKAERIILNLKSRFKNNNQDLKFLKTHSGDRKCLGDCSSRSTSSSYHTPVSSISLKLRSKSKHKSLHKCYSALKRKHTKLKLKYEHMSQKFRESLNVCSKLQGDVLKLTEKGQQKPQSVTVLTQTEKIVEVSNKAQNGRTTNILIGRLDAAAKVMANQCKNIENLQKQLNMSLNSNEILKKKLMRTETAAAGKEVLMDSNKREMSMLENKNLELTKEVTHLRNVIDKLKLDLSTLTEANNDSETQRVTSEQQLEEMKLTMEMKLNSLSEALQDREDMSEKAAEELEAKLTSLRNQFINHVTEARERLTLANEKIREFYLGIETFLKSLFNNGRPLTLLSPASEAEAVQKASDILQLAPGQVQNILLSSRQNSRLVSKWIKDLNHLVRTDVFSNHLAHVLLNAVAECNKLR